VGPDGWISVNEGQGASRIVVIGLAFAAPHQNQSKGVHRGEGFSVSLCSRMFRANSARPVRSGLRRAQSGEQVPEQFSGIRSHG
jgi:hypothetical protein